MDGWIDGWMEGWVVGWMVGQMDAWIDGWMDDKIVSLEFDSIPILCLGANINHILYASLDNFRSTRAVTNTKMLFKAE